MLIPSIDIQGGKVVQLRQGKDLVLESERDPVDLALEFNRFGEIAVIDLDAAMGTGDNLELLKQLCRVADVRVGGGIRDVDRARALLRSGAKQLIFGTAATPELLKNFPPELVMVALDQRNGTVFDKGWQNSTGESVLSRANRLAPYCNAFLTTFIEQEGGLGGIPMDLVKQLQDQVQRPLTVAGGIASTDEVIEISKRGIDVQVGMAIYTGRIDLADAVIGSVTFNKDGLCPTIVQDQTGQVLMMAYSCPESLKRALKEGKGIYFSRSRNSIWEKGLTSGNVQRLISCRVDCDRDALLFTVDQKNSACHNGTYSCFAGTTSAAKFSLAKLFKTLSGRKDSLPENSYSASLFRDRKLLFEKIAEESAEVIGFSSKDNLRWEIADLLYFLSVLAVAEGIEWKEIEAELGGRRK
jgi:phosphoribosyl-ATP pyrophosphohydrolase/phosphoribosyl-AMP cyclohydrolase